MDTLVNKEFWEQVAKRKQWENELHLIEDEERRERRRIQLCMMKLLEEEIIEKSRLLVIFKTKPEVFKFHLNMQKIENKN